MVKKATVPEFLHLPDERTILDVRTPAEFEKGHIPGAKNLPLFSDEERAEVGTLYKQVSPEKAFLRGLDLAGAKMSWYVKEAFRLAPGRKAAVHCWRGGKRSSSLATLLAFSGFEVEVLEGGYKAYRNHVLGQFGERKSRFIVLGGKTGSGKTEVLSHLAQLGEQVIDLEALANHKGSAFGALGEAPQPTVEQFENDIFERFDLMNNNQRIWVENESRSIGKLFIPQGLWEQMKSSTLFYLDVPFEVRIERLIVDYASYPKEELEQSLLKIERRMGGQQVKEALEAFTRHDLQKATGIALSYYDKTYSHATGQGNFSNIIEFPLDKMDAPAVAKQLIESANEYGY